MIQKWYKGLTTGQRILIRVFAYGLGGFVIVVGMNDNDSGAPVLWGLGLLFVGLFLDLGLKKKDPE